MLQGALGQILTFYPRTHVTSDGLGLTLRNPPPIAKKHFPMHNSPE